MEVTRDEFMRYVEVQEEGLVNMLSPEVQSMADITKAQHTYIISNYGKLADEYGVE